MHFRILSWNQSCCSIMHQCSCSHSSTNYCREMSLQSMFCNPAMRAAVPEEKRVSTSLWRLATGDCYRTCGLMMGVSKSTAIQCCHKFVHELNSLQGDFIESPITRQDAEKIEGFSQISKIQNVVAAIDRTHIPMKAPLNNHEDYFNRKHFYSYVMQAVCLLYTSPSPRDA